MSSPLEALIGRRFAAVLFDMDGTLIDSIPAVERSWVQWAGEYGVDPLALRGFHGVTARGVIDALLPDHSDDDRTSAFRRIEAIESADTDGIVILPGAAEALAALRDGGAKAAIVTSCTDPLAEARLAATGLARPDVIVTASQVTRGKPHPDPFLLAASRLGVDPADCLVVEDAVAGLISAADAGVGSSLAVLHTTAAAELAQHADAIVPDLSAVTFSVDSEGWASLSG